MLETVERRCQSAAFKGFVAELEDLRVQLKADAEFAKAVAYELKGLLHHQRNVEWLEKAFCEPCVERYRQHLLYVAPDGGFSVIALVWLPGQKTSIHNHLSWCVVGIYQGLECETRYNLHNDTTQGQYLVESPAIPPKKVKS